jgi:uncharacterized membrane protein
VTVVYQLLLYLHIMAGIIWVGGAIYVQVLALLVSRSGNPAELPVFAHRTEYIGTRLFIPAGVVLLLSGIVMVLQLWSFGQAWVAAALVLFILSAVSGAVYLGPRAKRAGQLFEAEGEGSPEARRLTGRLFLIARLELVSFAVIVALMVFKPGA